MKRDFQDEYQSYIESDVPDLWARIEPNLADKKSAVKNEKSVARKEKSKKLVRFMKTAIPIAACLCVLVVGIGVMQLRGQNKDMVAEAPMEAAGEEACADEPMEDAAESEAFMEDAAESEAPMEEKAPAESAPMEDAAEESEYAASDELQNAAAATEEKLEEISTDSENKMENSAEDSLRGESVKIETAVLTKIAVAEEERQDEGFAYAYTFRLEDESNLVVYLTNAQCLDLEEQGIEIKRQAVYTLTVIPLKSEENTPDTQAGEGILKKIEKLP